MIQVSHLSKCYGAFTAVEDLSFTLDKGGVYGFLGPNGAGKSTTMNIMTGCLSPTAGQVKIGGKDILEEPLEAKRHIGYLPEQPPLYMQETVEEYLTFVADAKGVKRKERQEQVEAVIADTGLEKVRGRLIAALSKGYKQRVGIAQALLGKPEVIILDEPTVGLDPLQILEIRGLIRRLGEEHTVIFSSHILSEVQAICQKVLIIAKGKLVAFDTPEKLEEKLKGADSVTFRVKCSQETAAETARKVEGLSGWNIREEEGILVIDAGFDEKSDREAVCAGLSLAFAGQGIPLLELKRTTAGLEDVFLELTDAAEAGAEARAEAGAEKTGAKEGEDDGSDL